ncbi:phosphoribosylanthranilate isomerase [Aridibaculum aurantiacum]|uniref:phosphoribosylanthranilate isomerase n=1 Tax=Aridibaculum aurantiacum TaxID=2810307 RepID=UPI001A97B712|nr:phosphoribosylanthranilate isomerase [Aridibaculum aurantiacum]
MKVKVCGITSIEQLHQLDELGVDYAGMIFYEKSARYVAGKLSADEVRTQKLQLKKVGVFVNAPLEEVLEQVAAYGLDLVQLHGKEDAEYSQQLQHHIPVVKALHVGKDETPATDEYAAADMLLFDTASKEYGGTGKKFNWQFFEQTTIAKPFFLSGGIAPGDVEAIASFARSGAAEKLYAIDINSRFETAPGVKDMDAISKFLQELKQQHVLKEH